MASSSEPLVLVDKDLLLKLLGKINPQLPTDPTLREISNVENELNDVLNEPPSSLQNRKVTNLISKHNFHVKNYEDSKLPQTPNRPPTPTPQPYDQPQDTWTSKTIDASPPRFQRATKSLLDHISKSDSLNWNLRGELIFDGAPIEGSNILDLVHALVRPRKIKPPPGSLEFVRGLVALNTPRELMTNITHIQKELSAGSNRKKVISKKRGVGMSSSPTPQKVAAKRKATTALSPIVPKPSPKKLRSSGILGEWKSIN